MVYTENAGGVGQMTEIDRASHPGLDSRDFKGGLDGGLDRGLIGWWGWW
jgi:hypothetical protein